MNIFRKIFKNKKYYFVSYLFENGNGCITFTTEHQPYLNLHKSIELINNEAMLGNIVITNIIKLSKKEYECFIWKKDE